jgi:hypothetical protein
MGYATGVLGRAVVAVTLLVANCHRLRCSTDNDDDNDDEVGRWKCGQGHHDLQGRNDLRNSGPPRRYSRTPAQACASLQGVRGSLTGPWAEPRSAKKKRWRRSPNRAMCRSRNKQSKTRMAGPYTGLGASCLEAGGVCDEKRRRSDDRPRKSDAC